MSKKTIFINILESIVVFPLALVGSLLIIPFIILYFIIFLPVTVIESVWEKDDIS